MKRFLFYFFIIWTMPILGIKIPSLKQLCINQYVKDHTFEELVQEMKDGTMRPKVGMNIAKKYILLDYGWCRDFVVKQFGDPDFITKYKLRASWLDTLTTVADELGINDTCIVRIKERFNQESLTLLDFAVAIRQEDYVMSIISYITHGINNIVEYGHGYGKRLGTLLDAVEDSMRETNNANALCRLSSIKEMLANAGGVTSQELLR